MRRSGVRFSSRAPRSVAIARFSRDSTPVQKAGGPLTGHKLVHFRTPGTAAGSQCVRRPACRSTTAMGGARFHLPIVYRAADGPRCGTQPAGQLRRGHLTGSPACRRAPWTGLPMRRLGSESCNPTVDRWPYPSVSNSPLADKGLQSAFWCNTGWGERVTSFTAQPGQAGATWRKLPWVDLRRFS